MLRKGFQLFFFCWVAAFLLLPAPADAGVRLRTGMHETYARLAFDWTAPTSYEVRQSAGQVSVKFSEPVNVPLARTEQLLRSYLNAIIPDRGGRQLIFDLKPGVILRQHFASDGDVIAFDFAKPGASTEKAVPSLPTIRVRSGLHPTYDRLVFDWENPPSYRVTQDGNTVRVVFDRSARFDTSRVNPPRSPRIEGIRTSQSEDKSEVVVTVPVASPALRHRHFISDGKSIVLDILGAMGQQTEAASAAQATTDPQKRVPPEPVEEEGLEEKMIAQATEEKAQAPETPETPAIQDSSAATETPDTEQQAEAFELPTVASKAEEPEELPFLIDRPVEGPVVPYAITQTGNTLRVEFGWDVPVQAAVFRRDHVVWIVFDRRAEMIESSESAKVDRLIDGVQQIYAPDGTVLRVPTASGVNPSISRDGASWVVLFQPSPFGPAVSVTPRIQPDFAGGPRVLLPDPSVGRIIEFTDPAVGDTLIAGPIETLGRGVEKARRFVDFQLLPSVHGFAVQSLADGTYMQPVSEGLSVMNARGLKISEPVTTEAGGGSSRIFRFEDWRQEEFKTFREAENHLFQQLATASPFELPEVRYELAKFYLSRGFFTEALAILELLEEEDSTFMNRPEAKAIAGGAHFMRRNYDEAAEHLLSPALDAFGEVALFRGALAALQHKWPVAAAQFAEAGTIPAIWPYSVRKELALLAIETAIAEKQFGDAEQILGGFEKSLGGGEFERFSDSLKSHYLQGKILLADDRINEAMAQLEKAAESDDQFVRSRSRFELIRQQAAGGDLEPAEAVAQLERLRFAWREPVNPQPDYDLAIQHDQFEFEVLELLGKMYVQNGQYRDALKTLRDAITKFAEVRDTSRLAELMTNTFVELFSGEEAAQLSPLTAVALFDEFRELTPLDEKGDQMIESLANRLVSVDLLDRAAELLDFQVNFRLQGIEKARVATRLALIYMLDQQPEKTLSVLEASEMDGLPAEMDRERRLLKARVLFETGDTGSAIQVLFNDFDYDADLLRADIYWRTQDWDMAARTLQRLVDRAAEKARTEPSSTHQNELRELILNQAVALALSNRDQDLTQLRQRYVRFMAGSSYEDLFNLITDTTIEAESTRTIGRFSELSSRFAKIDMFERFLDAYRRRLQDENLSDLY